MKFCSPFSSSFFICTFCLSGGRRCTGNSSQGDQQTTPETGTSVTAATSLQLLTLDQHGFIINYTYESHHHYQHHHHNNNKHTHTHTRDTHKPPPLLLLATTTKTHTHVTHTNHHQKQQYTETHTNHHQKQQHTVTKNILINYRNFQEKSWAPKLTTDQPTTQVNHSVEPDSVTKWLTEQVPRQWQPLTQWNQHEAGKVGTRILFF